MMTKVYWLTSLAIMLLTPLRVNAQNGEFDDSAESAFWEFVTSVPYDASPFDKKLLADRFETVRKVKAGREEFYSYGHADANFEYFSAAATKWAIAIVRAVRGEQGIPVEQLAGGSRELLEFMDHYADYLSEVEGESVHAAQAKGEVARLAALFVAVDQTYYPQSPRDKFSPQGLLKFTVQEHFRALTVAQNSLCPSKDGTLSRLCKPVKAVKEKFARLFGEYLGATGPAAFEREIESRGFIQHAMAVTYTPTQRELIAMSSFVELGIKKAPTKEARDRELEKFIAFAKENADLMTDLPTLSAEISQLLKITADSEEAAGQVPVSITNRILERVKFRSQAPLLIAELSQGAGFEDVSVGLQKQFGELNQTLQQQLEGFFAALPAEIQTTTPEQLARLNLGLSQAQDMLNRMYEARGSLYGSQVR